MRTDGCCIVMWPNAAAAAACFQITYCCIVMWPPASCVEGGGIGNASDLELAVLRALSQAATLQAKSVALPLMGAGRASWPTDTAAKLQIAAALQYIHQGTATSVKVTSHSCIGVCHWAMLLSCHVVSHKARGMELKCHKDLHAKLVMQNACCCISDGWKDAKPEEWMALKVD